MATWSYDSSSTKLSFLLKTPSTKRKLKLQIWSPLISPSPVFHSSKRSDRHFRVATLRWNWGAQTYNAWCLPVCGNGNDVKEALVRWSIKLHFSNFFFAVDRIEQGTQLLLVFDHDLQTVIDREADIIRSVVNIINNQCRQETGVCCSMLGVPLKWVHKNIQ